MADDKNNLVDLDAILSEINTNIRKEVSKAVKSPEKTTAKNQTKKQQTKSALNEAVEKKVKRAGSRKRASKNDQDDIDELIAETKEGKLRDEPSPAPLDPVINSSFVESASIIDEPSHNEQVQKHDLHGSEETTHTVRFIAVTASEVVEDIDPPPAKPPKAEDTDYLGVSHLQVSADAPVDPEVSRENNKHIKKMRKKKQKPKMTKRQKSIAFFGLIMTIFFVIGVISTIWVSIDVGGQLITRSSQKKDLAKEIFPLVIIDIPEFDDPAKLDSSTIISAAIWEFIIDEPDKSKYSKDDLGSIYVPDVDIEPYVRRLFGNDVKITHQSIDDSSVMMNYDSQNKMYNIESTPKFLPYTPRVDKIEKSGDIYTLKVSYVLPDAMWNLESDDKVEQIDKTMQYVLKKNKHNYQVLSVKLLSVAGMTSSASAASSSLEFGEDIIGDSINNEIPPDGIVTSDSINPSSSTSANSDGDTSGVSSNADGDAKDTSSTENG